MNKKIINKFKIEDGEELTRLYLKSDVLFFACVFEIFVKVSFNGFGINPLFCVFLPGYIWQCRLKYTGINLQTLQDKDLILTLENKLRGGLSSVMGNRYVKSDEFKNTFHIDANNVYGHFMSQSLPYDENERLHGHPDLHMKKLEEILKTSDDSEVGYFLQVDIRYPDNIIENA